MHVVLMRKKYAVYNRWEKGKMDDQALFGRIEVWEGRGEKGKDTHF